MDHNSILFNKYKKRLNKMNKSFEEDIELGRDEQLQVA